MCALLVCLFCMMAWLNRGASLSLTHARDIEFDNPDFGYLEDPVAYRQAFRMLKEACLYSKWDCPAKVKFVWHSWGASSDSKQLDDFYPGNDVVDWVGVSIFQQVNNATMMPFVDEVLTYAVNRNKQIMIAESTPFGGIVSWDDWFAPTLQLIERYDIAMWSYINSNWEAQPMWHYAGFGDTRLSINDDVMQQWQNHVLNGDRFLGAGALDQYCATTAVEQLSRKRHSNRTKHSHQYRPREQLAVAAFFIFWIILGLWVWHRRVRRYSLPPEPDSPLTSPSRGISKRYAPRQHYGSTAPEIYIS